MEKTIVKIWGREIPPYETFYWGFTEAYFRGVLGGGISRTVKCDDSLAILTKEKEEEMENEIKVIGKISSSQDIVVVDASGISPTHTSGHGNCPKIAEPYIAAVRGREPNVLTPRRTEYGKAVRREYERGELREPRRNMQRFEPRTDGVSNTLTSVSKDNYLVEPRIDNLGSYKPNGYNGSCVVGGSGNAPTVRENHGEVTAVMHPKYRIRKLTPRECFRLMDVDDADIDKIQGAGICNSQQYKLAGNSIVVNVLYHIFRKMFVDKDNEQQQLTLF